LRACGDPVLADVSSDLIQMLRYGKRLGEPGRELVETGPVTWEFPVAAEPGS